MESYTKPDNILNNMGGTAEHLDDRMQEIMKLLPFIPEPYDKVLDIGYGGGQIPYYFLSKGKNVSSIGLEIESYGIDIEKVRNDGINLTEGDVESIPFADESFDCVIASHVIEHLFNMGRAISEIKRVLKKGGVFVMLVPPYSEVVCAGHVNNGWNIGQIIYILTVLGFDTKNGNFVQLRQNVCAIVRKSDIQIPNLRGDRGDIQILNDAGCFPFQVSVNERNDRDNFHSKGIICVNWPDYSPFKQKLTGKAYVAKRICRLIKRMLGMRYSGLVRIMEEVEFSEKMNPENV